MILETRRTFAILVLLSLVPFAGCGGDSTKPTSAEIASFGRFCALVAQFQSQAADTGAASTPDTFNGTPAAFTALVDQMGPGLDEMGTAAPEEVSPSVRTVIDAVRRAKDNDTAAAQTPGFKEAIQRVAQFQQLRCQTKQTDQAG